MSKLKKLLISTLLGLTFLSSTIAKDKEKPKVNVYTEVTGQYQLRGLQITDKLTSQTTATANYKNFNLIFFGNKGLKENESNEADIMIDYTKNLPKNFSLTTGYAYLGFTGVDLNSQEIYATLSHNSLLNPTLTLAYDFDLAKGFYAEAGVGKDTKIGNIPLSLSGGLAFNHKYFREKSGLSHIKFDAKVPIKISDKITLLPGITATKSFNKQSLDDLFKISDELYPRIGVNIDF